jgi:hypothetical protein
VLRSIEGGLPDVHIGVVTSDYGANGGNGGGCSGTGDGGVMNIVKGAGNMQLGFPPARPTFTGGENYLIDESNGAGGRTTNYTGNLTTTFTQMATVGTKGCGFEQHLAAAAAAIEPNVNGNFLRADAFLAIVIIADEDDCSMQAGGALLAANAALGPLESFRCSEYGVKCDPDEMRAVGPRNNCVPRDNSMYELKISDLVQRIKARKGGGTVADKKIIVAGITAPSEPWIVGRDTRAGKEMEPKMQPACTYNNPNGGVQEAAAAVRTNTFLTGFPNNSQTTICKDDLSDALTQIGLQLKAVIGTPCFDAKLKEPPSCTVADVTNFGDPNQSEKLMDQCNAGSTNTPCWTIATDVAKCPAPATGKIIKFERGGTIPAPNTVTTVACETTK